MPSFLQRFWPFSSPSSPPQPPLDPPPALPARPRAGSGSGGRSPFLGYASGRGDAPLAARPARGPLFLGDDWSSKFGHGSSTDRSAFGTFSNPKLKTQELVDLYNSSGLVQQGVSGVFEVALRNGWKVASAKAGNEINTINEQIQTWVETDQIDQLLELFCTQTALFGGALLLQVSKDNQEEPYTPRVGPVRFISLPYHALTCVELDRNLLSPNFGFPRQWSYSRNLAGAGNDSDDRLYIDPSWGLPDRTVKISDNLNRNSNDWQGPPVLQKFYDDIKRWGLSVQAVTSALQELSRTVYKIPGLDLLTMTEHGEKAVYNRKKQIEEAASLFNATVLDQNEEMARLPLSLAGIGDVQKWLVLSLAASTRTPITVLFGVSPGGFGTGESELRQYEDRARRVQRQKIRPFLRWVLDRATAAGQIPALPDDYQIKFNPLVTPTESEVSELRHKTAQTDAVYLSYQVVTPEEVAQSRFGGSEYQTETTLDPSTRGDKDPFNLAVTGEESEASQGSAQARSNETGGSGGGLDGKGGGSLEGGAGGDGGAGSNGESLEG